MTDPGRESAQAIGFEQSPDLQLVTSGPEQRILACNASLRRLVGGRDLTGETMADALGSVFGDPVLELFEEVLRSGETHRLDGWQVHATHSGEWTHADLTISPWRDEQGRIAGCIGRGTDGASLAPQREAAHTRYSAAMDLVTNLQDALLPVALPVAPALDIAATYLLATDDARAGGDWFDAIVRADGTVALVVGDTVGQGVQASAVMGQLRAVLHGRLLSDEPISESLRSLDRYARLHPESHAATVCVVVVDPASGDIEYCTAGHPPPLVVGGDGSTRFLPTSGAGPLTTESDYPTARERIDVEDLVLLYTDGLTERPGMSPAEGADDVARAAAWAALSAEGRDEPVERRSVRVCERTLEVLTRRTGYSDDITLLSAHRTPAFPEYRTTIARSPDAVRVAREELDGWLASLQVALLDEFAVLHAVGELITNAVEHAYPLDDSRTDAVDLRAVVEPDGYLVCTVADRGRWSEGPPHPDRGRGLGMVSGLVDHLTIDRAESGTTARFRKRLTRTAEVLTGSRAPVEGTADPVPFGTAVQGDLMRVQGPIDLSTADTFRASLRRFSRGGTAEVTVDLGGVTHLGSAGVQVLHEVRSMDGTPLHLRAPAGSIAQHVLELVRLPYDEESPPIRGA